MQFTNGWFLLKLSEAIQEVQKKSTSELKQYFEDLYNVIKNLEKEANGCNDMYIN